MARKATPRPPVARKIPYEIVTHGDRRVDEYFWMRDRSNPEVMKYIRAENRYTSAVTAQTKPLQAKLVREMRAGVKEEDQSVPEKNGIYYYYTRTEKGKQHTIYCRKKGSLDADEEVLLDVNRIAKGHKFFRMDVHEVAPDHSMLAYLVDTTGSERHTIYIKDLRTGELLTDRMENASRIAWANDSRTLFYSIMDDEFRPYKVLRHIVGTDPKNDVEVYHEKDKMFYYMSLRRTKTNRFLTITVESAMTSEVWYISADRPADHFKVLRPREHGVIYFLMDRGDKFLVITNERAKNFKVVEAPISDPSPKNWRDFITHREDVAINVSDPFPWVEVFEEYIVLYERENALPRIEVVRLADKSTHVVDLPEKLSFVQPVRGNDFGSKKARFLLSSMVTPDSVYDYDMVDMKLELKKTTDVPGYDPSKYETRRIFATASDGAKIPITMVHKKGLKRDDNNPGLLYGYGGYGDLEGGAPTFDHTRRVFLDRGFVWAIAAVRGGGDCGEKWHEQGRLLTKINTFTDFIASAEYLISEGYVAKDKLAIIGRSAGGLLMGAVTNMRPDLFKVVLAEVPYVDAINSMLDDTIPLTAGEFEEWGNPKIKEYYDYFKIYSPYDNVEAKDYPNILVTGSWNDSRVCYWEPLKWTARLRAMKTDNNALILRTNIVEGHAFSPGRFDALKEFAFEYAFVLDRLGIKS